MKTSANSFFCAMRMACLALVLSATAARCQQAGGILAMNGITLDAALEIDSFDSSDPNHCIWQSNAVYRANYFSPGINYGIWSNSLSYVSNSFPSRTADVTLFTGDGFLALNGNITLAGYVATGPEGTQTMSANSTVGDLTWCFGANGGGGGSTGLELGHWIQNVNLNLHSYPLPSPVNPVNGWMNWSNISAPPINSVIKIGGIWWLTNGVWTNIGGAYYTNTSGNGFTIGGVTYPLIITNRLENTNFVYYSLNQLTQSLFVDAQYVVLYLTNGWNYGTSRPTFMLNTNADIVIYSAGNITASGQSFINNLGNYTHAFSIYDVAGHPITVNLGGNAMATGFYYLPSSSLSLGGGGIAGDFVGSIICSNFVDGGHVNIHSDDSLGGLLPWIIQQPTNQIVPLSSDVTFSVNAGGSELAYQWYFVSTDSTYYWPYTNSVYAATNLIPGATNSSLAITNVRLTNQGYYGVVITNPVGSVKSYPASLTVYTNAAATLSGSFNPTNGEFQFNVTGVTGLDYTLEASTNLVDWVPLWTNASPFSFTESNTEAYPQRFYRSVFIP